MRARNLACLVALGAAGALSAAELPRPNILWITSEDNGPHLGCYGDAYARTPSLDALAARGVIYRHVWSNAPVCAPARTAIISGVYPSSTGSEHMRSQVAMPSSMRMYPQILREAGYYCTNNSKEDYNLDKPGQVWDESSPRAHWRNRRPGQPFFAVFNHTVTHESQVRLAGHKLVHDPAAVRVPRYHPDIPEVRRAWAQYYDKLTEMDALAGRNLRQIDEAGLAEDTIIFYYGDHGPGLPRCKRSACDSGLRVPLIVYIPPKYRHLAPPGYAAGGRLDRLVSFVDLAPTVLSLAGVRPPEWMQGAAFLGPHIAPAASYLHGLRGRMDERHDLVRSIRDDRYVYVRNFMPHRPHGQHNAYMFETPATQSWKWLFDEGRLAPEQAAYWEPKRPEELYDLQADPDEVNNLAKSPGHEAILRRLREAMDRHLLAIRDVGLLPENEIHDRSQGSTPYEMGHDARRYPLEQILRTAQWASSLDPAMRADLCEQLRAAEDSAVRYWAAMGLLMGGPDGVKPSAECLKAAMKDAAASVRVPAAEALARFGSSEDRAAAMGVLLELADVRKSGLYVAVQALNAIDACRPLAPAELAAVDALPASDPAVVAKMSEYITRLKEAIASSGQR